jgi:phasin family protein
MSFARTNIEAGFALAQRLVKAKDLKEAMELQADFARKQMETYGEQARKLTSLMSDMASKSQPKS